MRFQTLQECKQSLLQPPVMLQAMQAITSLIVGLAILFRGLPSLIDFDRPYLPKEVIGSILILNSAVSLASLSLSSVSNVFNVTNHLIMLFLWTAGATLTLTTPYGFNNAFAYLVVFPLLSSFWILVHALVFTQNDTAPNMKR